MRETEPRADAHSVVLLAVGGGGGEKGGRPPAPGGRPPNGGGAPAVARHLQKALGVGAVILPMSDEPVRTEVRTDDGWLEFQEYFVHRRQEPTVHEVRFRGIDAARPTPEVTGAIENARTIVIA